MNYPKVREVYALRDWDAIPGGKDPWRAPILEWFANRKAADDFEYSRRLSRWNPKRPMHKSKGFNNVIKMHVVKINGKWYRINALPFTDGVEAKLEQTLNKSSEGLVSKDSGPSSFQEKTNG